MNRSKHSPIIKHNHKRRNGSVGQKTTGSTNSEGYDIDFDKLTLTDVMCSICLSIMIEPVSMPCKHILCMRCFQSNVAHSSLACPFCRKRIGVWVRKQRNDLINNKLWDWIKDHFKEKVEARLNDKEDFEDSLILESPLPRLSAPGEIRLEYEEQLRQLHHEEEQEREKEEEKSGITIQSLKQEDQREKEEMEKERNEISKTDFEIAKQLQNSQMKGNMSALIKLPASASASKIGPMDLFIGKRNSDFVTFLPYEVSLRQSTPLPVNKGAKKITVKLETPRNSEEYHNILALDTLSPEISIIADSYDDMPNLSVTEVDRTSGVVKESPMASSSKSFVVPKNCNRYLQEITFCNSSESELAFEDEKMKHVIKVEDDNKENILTELLTSSGCLEVVHRKDSVDFSPMKSSEISEDFLGFTIESEPCVEESSVGKELSSLKPCIKESSIKKELSSPKSCIEESSVKKELSFPKSCIEESSIKKELSSPKSWVEESSVKKELSFPKSCIEESSVKKELSFPKSCIEESSVKKELSSLKSCVEESSVKKELSFLKQSNQSSKEEMHASVGRESGYSDSEISLFVDKGENDNKELLAKLLKEQEAIERRLQQEREDRLLAIRLDKEMRTIKIDRSKGSNNEYCLRTSAGVASGSNMSKRTRSRGQKRSFKGFRQTSIRECLAKKRKF